MSADRRGPRLAGVRTLTLENGGRIVVAADPRGAGPPVAAIQLWVLAGTAVESPRQHGCAHLLEHMLFKPAPGLVDLATAIEDLGGDVNAYTSHDETVFHATVPAETVLDGLDALIRPVLAPALDPEQLRREAQVVVEEIEQDHDDPASRAAEAMMAALYAQHGYGRSVLGDKAAVESVTPRVLRAFHRRHYVGRRLVLVVTGPVSAAAVVRRARRLLEKCPAGRVVPRTRPAIGASARGASVSIARADLREVHISLGFVGPALPAADAAALDAAAVVVGHGDASRLATELQRRDGLVHDVGAALYGGRHASTFVVSARTEPRRLGAACRGIAEAVAGLSRVPVDAEELTRAQAILRSDLVYRRETQQGQAHALGYYLSLCGDLDADRRYHEAVTGLSPTAVRDACARSLSAAAAAWSAVGPGPVRRTRAAVAPATRAMARRPKARVRRPAPSVAAVDLPSGIRLRVHADPSLPMAAGWLIWPGGQRLERARDAGAGMLIGRLLTRGTATRDGDALARELDGYAAVIDGFAGRNTLGLHFECLSSHLPTVLRRAAQCAAAPAFDADEFETQRRIAKAELRADSDDAATVAVRTALSTLYGAHPYGRRRRGTTQTLAALSPERLRRIWHDDYPLGRAVVALAGDVDLDMVLALSEELWHRVEPAKAPRWPGRPPRARTKPTHRTLSKRRQQTHIAWAYPGLALTDPRAEALEVLTAIVGGQAGRLFDALRERQGLVYDVSISQNEGIDAGHVLVHASTRPSRRAATEAALGRELESVAAGVTATELARAKAWLIGQFHAGSQRRGRIASQLGVDEALGLGCTSFLAYPRRIAAVSRRAVRDLAQELLDPRRRISVVVGR